MQPTHGGQHWTEPPGSGVAQAARRAFLADDGDGNWDIRTGNAREAIAVDLGDGQFTTIDLDSPWIITDTGTEYLIADSGTVGAVLTDDGHGGLLVAAVGAEVDGALLLDAGNGDIVPVRDDAPELRFIELAGTTIFPSPPSA